MSSAPDRDPVRIRDRSEVDAELEHHTEMLVDMLVAEGMERAEAEAEARRRFGDPDEVRRALLAMRDEPTRGRAGTSGARGRFMSSLKQDVVYALRTLVRVPGFTAVVVLTLALGIGANAAIFSVFNGILLQPLGVRDVGTLVSVVESNPEQGQASSPASRELLADWRDQVSAFESLGAFTWGSRTLEDAERPEELTTAVVSGDYFATVGARARFGRVIQPDDALPGVGGTTVMLSHDLWVRRFGADPGVLGRTIRVEGAALEVIGVMSADQVVPGPDADIWVPGSFGLTDNPNRGVRIFHTVARLRPGATVESARAEVASIAERAAIEFPTQSTGWTATVVPFREAVLGDVSQPLGIAFAAVGLLLLIACVNIANLLLARSASRESELAVRRAMGAGSVRIIRQLLTESLVLALLGGAVGIAVAYGAHSLLLALEPGVLPRMASVRLDGDVLAFAALLSVLTGVLFGMAPAFRVTSAELTGVLKSGGTRGTTGAGHTLLRRFLVVGQLALTVLLLAGAGLLGRTFLALRSVDPGFDPTGVAAARVPMDFSRYASSEQQLAYRRLLVDRVRNTPGVVEAGLTSSLPMDPVAVNFDLPFRTEDEALSRGDALPQADFRMVSPGALRALRYRLLEGRLLEDADRADAARVVVVNRTMAERYWPGQSAVGHRLETVFGGWTWYEIVGVVDDTRFYGLDQDARAEMYVPAEQAALGFMTVVARGRDGMDPVALQSALEGAIVDADPLMPPQEVFAVEDLVARSIGAERFYATLLGIFALVATVLAAAGVYGVLSYWVSMRGREIGVRMALGAPRGRVIGMVVRSATALAALGIAIGLVATAGATRLLSGMLFGVEALDPVTLVGVSLALGLTALVACLVPALRAGRVDPVEALRE